MRGIDHGAVLMAEDIAWLLISLTVSLIAIVIALYFLKKRTGAQGWRVRVRWFVHRVFTFVIWVLFKKVPWKPILVWGPWVAIVLVFAFYGIENWRGKRAWEKAEAEFRSRGEELNPEAYYPPDPPALDRSELVRMGKRLLDVAPPYPSTPGLSKNYHSYEWPTRRYPEPSSVRKWLFPSKSSLSEREAARKILGVLAPRFGELDEFLGRLEECDYRVRLDGKPGEKGVAPDAADWFLRSIYRALRARALLHLHAGEIDACVGDIVTCLRILEKMELPHQPKRAMGLVASKVVWELLRLQLCDSNQLATLQSALSKIDLRQYVLTELRARRAFYVEGIDHFRANRGEGIEVITGRGGFDHLGSYGTVGKLGGHATVWLAPTGWFDQLKVRGTRGLTSWIERFERIGTSAELGANLEIAVEESGPGSPERGLRSLGSTSGVAAEVAERVWFLGKHIGAMQVAVALEQYRLETGSYPLLAGKLVPRYLADWPYDPERKRDLEFWIKEDGTPVIKVGTFMLVNGWWHYTKGYGARGEALQRRAGEEHEPSAGIAKRRVRA